MNPILIAILILAAIGVVAAALLVLADRFMSVPVDETFTKIRECLPGANCGGCGYAGCDGYANALADGSEKEINKCAAGGQTTLDALAAATGQEAGEMEKKVAFVRCRGTSDVTEKKEEFYGQKTCKAAKLLFGGDGACAFGCIGYGDCAAACTEQAINIINGLAHVNENRCMGCGVCTKTCPQGIMVMVPAEHPSMVACMNHEKGPIVNKNCKNGCIGCGLCVKKCEYGAIRLEKNLAVIDMEKCNGCNACKEACPKKCIL